MIVSDAKALPWFGHIAGLRLRGVQLWRVQRGPGASWQHSVKNEGLLFPGQASPTKKLSKCLEMTPSRCVFLDVIAASSKKHLDVHSISLYILYQLYVHFSLSILSRKSCSCRSAETWHKVSRIAGNWLSPETMGNVTRLLEILVTFERFPFSQSKIKKWKFCCSILCAHLASEFPPWPWDLNRARMVQITRNNLFWEANLG